MNPAYCRWRAKLVLAVMVFTSVTAAHAQDGTAEYEAAVASIERFNEANREAGLPEMDIPSYAEWLQEKEDAEAKASTNDTAAIEDAATASLTAAVPLDGQGGSPPPAAPLSGGLSALQLYEIWAAHCGNSTNAATTDDDGDGISNQDEVLAGTDPDDEYDYFSVVDFVLQSTNMLVSYVTETLRDYELQTTTNLVQGSWAVTGTATGTGEIVTHSIPLETFRHYRANMAGALDSDGDGVPDWLEYCAGTGPFLADTDGDGITDDQELLNGTAASGMHVNGHLGQFRVWAPNATNVEVRGDFEASNWTNGISLTSEGTNGYWSGSVTGITQGTEYKFVLDGNNWRRDPTCRKLGAGTDPNSVYDNPYEFTWTDEDFEPPPINEMVIYQMHIGGFNVSGSTQGTFADALNSTKNNLEYIADLGFNVIELLPVAEFGTSMSWGYNPSYPYAIERIYGTPNDLKAFVDEAHSLGMAVFFDVVYNHWEDGDDIPGVFNTQWNPTAPDDLWQFDGWYNTNHPGGIYYYNSDGTPNELLHWTQWGPRPNYSRSEVRDYIKNNALMWIQEFHGDGLRWDATKAIRNKDRNLGRILSAYDLDEGWTIMQDVNSALHQKHPDYVGIAEDLADPTISWQTNDMFALTEASTDTTHNVLGGADFDSQWDHLEDAKRWGIVYDRRIESPWTTKIKEDVEREIGDDIFHRNNYITSHDEVNHNNSKKRIAVQIADNNGLTTTNVETQLRCIQGNALVILPPGIPLLFMGDEFGDDGGEGAGASGGWSEGWALEWSKTNTMSSVLDATKELVMLRRNEYGTTKGLTGPHADIHHMNDNDETLGFHRYHTGGTNDDVLVAFNFSEDDQRTFHLGAPTNGTWKVRFVSNEISGGNPGDLNDEIQTTTTSTDGMPYRLTLKPGAYSVVILSRHQ